MRFFLGDLVKKLGRNDILRWTVGNLHGTSNDDEVIFVKFATKRI
jgi:hypothetical protein